MSNKNLFGLKKDNPSQRNCQNQLSQSILSYIEQESQEIIQEKILIQQYSSNIQTKTSEIDKPKF